MKKLELWKRKAERYIYILTFETCLCNETDANKKSFSSTAWVLRRNNSRCILKIYVSNFGWVRSPCAQEQLTDISCDGPLEDMFGRDKLPQF
jgi:hypothetical protein